MSTMKMKRILALLLAALMVFALAACGADKQDAASVSETFEQPQEQTAEPAPEPEPDEEPETAETDSDLAYVQDKGVLVVGITDFEPMDYQDDNGEWIGFDADLASAFAESLGVDVEFIEIDWDGKILELDSKAIDCVWNGMTLTPEVTSATSCSNPYMRNAQVIVLPADAAEHYADVDSMADLTFAVEAGSAGEQAVGELGYATTAVSTQADALMEVSAGTSDAAVIDLLMAYAMTGEGTGYDDLTYTFSLNEEEYGVAFRAGSDLTAALNSYLVDAYGDGTMDALAETYGLAGSVIAQGASAPAADGESDLAYVQENGVLVVGITDFEPMDYKNDSGEWIGFDADLASAFAESLGVNVEFIEIDWDGKILELDSKAIDCIWNGMTLTPEVTSATSCSNPYMRNAQVIVLPADAAEQYADVDSMADLTFAVEAGSAGEQAVGELGYATTAVPTQADALMEVAAGTSDAAVIDLLMAYAMTGEGTGYDSLTYTFSLNEEEYGVAFRAGSDLTAALNSYLVDAYGDGTMDALAETYGLAGSVIAQG